MDTTALTRAVILTSQQIASLRELLDIKTESLFDKQLLAQLQDRTDRVKLYADTIAYWEAIDRVLRNS